MASRKFDHSTSDDLLDTFENGDDPEYNEARTLILQMLTGDSTTCNEVVDALREAGFESVADDINRMDDHEYEAFAEAFVNL
jgi:hypothetical protein